MSFGDFLWSLLIFYFIFFYFMVLFRIIGDLFSDHESSGWAKAGWVIFLLLFPFIAIVVYMVTKGKDMTARAMGQAQARDAAQREYIREAAGATEDPVSQISKAKDLLGTGAITEAEFNTLKAKALAT